MADLLFEKRKHVIWLQWLLVVAISYLLYFNRPEGAFGLFDTVILTFIVLNVGLFFVPAHFYQTSSIDFLLVFFDIVFVSLAIYLTGQAASDFYLFFFLVLMMAAAGQNLKALIVGILTISGLYAWMVFKTGIFSFTSAFLLRIPFLFIVGLFFGYLVYMQKMGERRLQAESEFTVDLFEFGKALVQTQDLDTLYSKIPRLVNIIMATDACELALIDGEQITRRVFENSEPERAGHMEVAKSIHEKTFRSDEIELMNNLGEEKTLAEKEDFGFYPAFQSYMGKSWRSENRPSGLIAVYRKSKNSWTDHDFKKFQFLADQSVLALQYVQLLKELEMQARTDGLTGLANYRYFSERIEEEFSRAGRKKAPLSVILMDIDKFKLINDNWGHAVGDEILRSLSRVIKMTSRHMDVAARRGGDEFIILLPETDEGEVKQFARRLLDAVLALDMKDLPSFSISVGSSTFPQNGSNISELLEHADQALYFSKGRGRACTSHYSEIGTEV